MIEFKLTGIDGAIELLKSLPPEVVSKRGGPVKTALRKAALVILKEEKSNLQAVMATQDAADQRKQTGLLLANVIASRGKAPSDGNGERYLVRVRRRTYHGTGKGTGSRAVTTLKSAQILEYGSAKQPARPWIRAAASKVPEAIHTGEVELNKAIEAVVKKLQAQTKGK